MNNKFKPNWAALGATRFFLAAIVFLYHLENWCEPNLVTSLAYQFNSFAAVIGFLVISGYSIAHSYNVNPQGFYSRRIERVYPVYFASLVLAIIPFLIVGPVLLPAHGASVEISESLVSVIGNFFMLQSTLVTPIATLSPSWTLAHECVFYALTPLFARLKLKHAVALSVLMMGVYVLFFSPYTTNTPKWGIVGLVSVLAPLSTLGFWLLGWVLYHAKSLKDHPLYTKIEIGLILGVPIVIAGMNGKGALVPVTTGIVLCVIFHPEWFALNKKQEQICTYLGDLSYPLYLVHVPVSWLISSVFKISNFGVLFASSIIVTLLVYHLIDRPYRQRTAKARQIAKNTEPLLTTKGVANT
jgi:peptidoglycan/LPS O-acetylase OafA/YrhL